MVIFWLQRSGLLLIACKVIAGHYLWQSLTTGVFLRLEKIGFLGFFTIVLLVQQRFNRKMK